MLNSEIRPRTDYALREKRIPGAPLEHVRIVAQLRRNKWKVEWIDPNPFMPQSHSLLVGPHRGRSSEGEHRPEDDPLVRRLPPRTVPSAISHARRSRACPS